MSGWGLINDGAAWDTDSQPGVSRLKISGKELVLGVDYDTIDITYPTTTTEEYSYKKSALEVFRIKITYATAAKKDLTKVEVL